MEFESVVRSRRMIRDFRPDAVKPELLDELLDLARRVPSAGFSQGIDFIVLEGPEQTARFWDRTLPADRREKFPWPGLLLAPVVVLPMSDERAYLSRYSEPDKQHAGLGDSRDSWPVPYWHIDTGMAAMVLLQAAVNAGLGALFFGIFANEAELLCDLGVPTGVRPIGAIALGYPTEAALARKSEASAKSRSRRDLTEIVHRNGW
jgi:nitroreductase